MSVRVDPEVLRNEADIRGLSMRDLGKKAGLSDATMSNAAACKPIAATSLQLIAKALKATPRDEGIARLLGPAADAPADHQPPTAGSM